VSLDPSVRYRHRAVARRCRGRGPGGGGIGRCRRGWRAAPILDFHQLW